MGWTSRMRGMSLGEPQEPQEAPEQFGKTLHSFGGPTTWDRSAGAETRSKARDVRKSPSLTMTRRGPRQKQFPPTGDPRLSSPTPRYGERTPRKPPGRRDRRRRQ